jgi:hypothetical protein
MPEQKPEPFHIVIVDMVNSFGGARPEVTLSILIRLTKWTEIPANHDAIAAAFKERALDIARHTPVDLDGVIEYIESEKKRHKQVA